MTRSPVEAALDSGRLSEIRDALREIESTARGRPFSLAIARTFTFEAQLDALSLALSLLPCRPTLCIGDYGVIEPALLDVGSPLLQAQPDAVLVLWRFEDLYPEFVESSSAWSLERRREAFVAFEERLRFLCGGFAAASAAPLFLSTFPMPRYRAGADATLGYGVAEVTARLNALLFELAATTESVYVFDFAGWAARSGDAAFDPKLDFFARQPIAPNALGSFSREVARTVRPLIVPPCKVLALDLDNVLWGGILGEDGIDGVRIGREFPGNVYREIQVLALALKAQGVLLALVSKNNESDVVEAFERLTDMPLRLNDFAAVRANWETKSSNLGSIADELNLGLDSFAFVDDQEFEREEVSHSLPTVNVINGGSDPLGILRALQETDLFCTLRVTEADRLRAEDYRAQRERNRESQGANAEEFLHSLLLEAEITPLSEGGIERAAQMLAKTNQFNATTRRHNVAELRRMIADGRTIALTMSLRDRFSNQGVIALAIATAGETPETLHVDTFLMSCRALGRGAENALWSRLLELASASGARALLAQYIATSKNEQVSDLFDRFGMERVAEESGTRSYRIALPVVVPPPPWIDVRVGS